MLSNDIFNQSFPEPQPNILEYQFLVNNNATVELSGNSAFDMILLRTSEDNIRVVRHSMPK